MSVKDNHKKAFGSSSNKKTGKSVIQDFKEELKKVSWTTQEELKFCTRIVVYITLIFGIGIYAIDLSIKGFLDVIKIVFQGLFG